MSYWRQAELEMQRALDAEFFKGCGLEVDAEGRPIKPVDYVPDGDECGEQEQAIDLIARALVDAKRN